MIPAISYLAPHIRAELDKSVDPGARLFTLISYPASDIHPDLYCHFYNLLDRPLSLTLRNLIIKRLIFHRRFDQCWDICLQTHTQLNDVEDFIDVGLSNLEQCNDHTFGLFGFISASQRYLQSTSYHHQGKLQLQKHILETFSYKLNKPRDWIDSSLNIEQKVSDVHTAESVRDIMASARESDPLVVAICIRKLLLMSEEIQISSSDLALISHHPGWLSFVCPGEQGSTSLPSVGEYLPTTIDSHASVRSDKRPSKILNSLAQHLKLLEFGPDIALNDLDATVMLSNNANANLVAMFLQYLKSIKRLTPPRAPSNHIVNHIMAKLLEENDYELSKMVVIREFEMIDRRVLVRFLIISFTTSLLDFKQISQKISRRKDFSEVLQEVVSGIPTPLSAKELEVLMYLATKCPCPRKTIELVLRPRFRECYNKSHLRSLFGRLIAARRMQKPSILGEIGVLMLQDSRIIDKRLLGRLLDALLSSAFAKKLPSRNDIPRTSLSHHDIQRVLGGATYSQRAQFHNNIRRLGLTIANLNADQVSSTLDHLRSHIMSNEFAFVTSEYGKTYIADAITNEVVKFIILLHKQDLRGALTKLKTVKVALKSRNDRFLSWVVKFTVQDRPQIALEMIHAQRDRKAAVNEYMKYIMLGILHSPRLDANEKVDLLRNFVTKAENLNYAHVMPQMVLYNIVTFLKGLKATNQQLSPDSKDWITNLLKTLKSIHRVAHICNWAENDPTRQSSILRWNSSE